MRRIAAPRCVIAWFAALLLASACGRAEVSTDAPPAAEGGPAATEVVEERCVERLEAPALLPGVQDEHRTLAYWLERTLPEVSLDEPLLTPQGVRALSASYGEGEPYRGAWHDFAGPLDEEELWGAVEERIAHIVGRFDERSYVNVSGEPVSASTRSGFHADAGVRVEPSVHLLAEAVQVRCGPTLASFYTPSLDLRFDRNHCSTMRPHEPFQVVAEWPGDLLLVRGGYTLGWIPADTARSPALSEELVGSLDERATIVASVTHDGVALSAGDRAPVVDGELLLGAPGRLVRAPAGPEADTGLAFTRREVLAQAFAYLDRPYGWGGTDGGRDCSRFVMDVLSRFGIAFPRFSGHQALAGSFSLDISGVDSEAERLLLLDAAWRRGVVLLHFPGHIMLYLGRDHEGRPMAIHSFAEYLEPCEEAPLDPTRDPETLIEVDRVTVSDLELGRGTSRTAFIERLTRVTVIGGTPGVELQALAERRPAVPPTDVDCVSDERLFLLPTPRRPNREQELAAVAVSSEDLGPLAITFIDPDGNHHVPPVEHIGGPPYGARAALSEPPAPGMWTVVAGDGERVRSCRTVTVGRSRPEVPLAGDAVWENRSAWDRDLENLYSVWVERLFSYDLEEDLTWTDLHTLVQNDDNNLLHDYYGWGEDDALTLTPDCADLPYMLRAYFAWKVGAPFGYRACSRGGPGRPPRCRDLSSNLQEPQGADAVSAFERFAQRAVRNGVHSASGRTHPDDDETDYYPVPLTREALRPGTLYADPYGHLLIVAGWQSQGLDSYGVLVGADAQPDKTVGRRRFWRGSFLFSPETTDVGAGFKAFRPVVAGSDGVRTLTNAELARGSAFVPFSRDQYEISVDGFYARMEAIINPRPLDPRARMLSLIDALDESVARRVNSVENGEAYLLETGYATVEMPSGYAIFETVGAWENYSTPSRDMRLLISIDTVAGFPDAVAAAPERYGILPSELGERVEALRASLADELERRSFDYTRSDGSMWTLTLADVVARAPNFEASYNPNDCAEVRWAAAPTSEEFAPCDRRAPAAQAERMEGYRPWFEARQRPPRGTR